MTDNRRHPRLLHRAKLKVTVPCQAKQFLADMRDFSESGLFIMTPMDLSLNKGTLLEVQTTEFEDAPVQTVKVVRIEPGVGVGVEFV